MLEGSLRCKKYALITVKSSNRYEFHDVLIKSPIAQRKLNNRLSIGDKAQIEKIIGHDFDSCQFTIFIRLCSITIFMRSIRWWCIWNVSFIYIREYNEIEPLTIKSNSRQKNITAFNSNQPDKIQLLRQISYSKQLLAWKYAEEDSIFLCQLLIYI